jgi:hypothetical protein
MLLPSSLLLPVLLLVLMRKSEHAGSACAEARIQGFKV